jgi:hypothetical protein
MLPEDHHPENLYLGILRHIVRKLDNHFQYNKSTFSLFLDAIDGNEPGSKRKFRMNGIETTSISMFGADSSQSLLEPPYQLESHLYQNMQCADWFCGLFGRRYAYRTFPSEYADFSCIETYFGVRLDDILKAHSFKTNSILKVN